MHFSSPPTSKQTLLPSRIRERVIVAWIVCALIGLLAIGLLTVGMLFRLRQFNDPATFNLSAPWTVEKLRAALAELHLPMLFYPLYRIALNLLSALSFFVIAAMIFWHKRHERMALFVTCFLLFFGAVWNVPTDRLAFAYPQWGWVMTMLEQCSWGSLLLFFFLFPDGHFVPARIRWPLISLSVIWVVVGGIVPLVDPVRVIAWFGCMGTVIAVQFYRYRRIAGPVQRQQIKWMLFGFLITVVALLLLLVIGNTFPALQQVGTAGLIYGLVSDLLGTLVFLPIPLSIGLAMLRYRLWDVDVLISRTLVSSLMAIVIAGVYILIVGAFGVLLQASNNLIVALVATGVVAVIFHPVRERLQRGINRLIYGDRDDPSTVISRLAHRLQSILEPEAVLPTIVEHVAASLKLPHASLWTIEAEVFALESMHSTTPLSMTLSDPETVEVLQTKKQGMYREGLPSTGAFAGALTQLGADFLLPLISHGELVGTLCLARRSADEAFSPTDERLLRELAVQTGATVHAVRLDRALRLSLQEVQQSRLRLVAAQEEERRRIQRDLHDGLGPTLASIRMRLLACQQLAENVSADLMQELEHLDGLAKQATADIRRLVYALRPPMLDQVGLVASLQHHIESLSDEAGLSISLQADDTLVLPAAVEVALFRVVQEALVNVHKHAAASQVQIELKWQKEEVVLLLRDNGRGFSLHNNSQQGTGLASMRERAEILGGSLQIITSPGNGTALRMQIPVKKGEQEHE